MEKEPNNLEENNESNSIKKTITSLRKKGFTVLDSESFGDWWDGIKEIRNKHIYGDDLEWISQLQKKHENDIFYEKAERYLKKNGIGDTIEDILYEMYQIYRNKDSKTTLSHDMKLRVKGQLKFWIENLIWMIKNSPEQINDVLGNISFILSERHSLLIILDGDIAKESKEIMGKTENLSLFLKTHRSYKKIFNEIIQGLSKVEKMKNIKKTLSKINKNRNSFSNDEKKDINSEFYCVWDMGLQYIHNPRLYGPIESLILWYQKLEDRVKQIHNMS